MSNDMQWLYLDYFYGDLKDLEVVSKERGILKGIIASMGYRSFYYQLYWNSSVFNEEANA